MIPTKQLTCGFSLPVLGFGTYLVGGHREPDSTQDTHWLQILKQVLDLGYTHLDTAESYGGWGHAEELIGRAIKHYDRKKLFLTTKVDPKHLAYDDVVQAANQSLKRLGVKYVDLYLVHFYNSAIPLQETMRALDFLVDKGLIKHIGVSNFTTTQLQEAQQYTKHKIVANQLRYNLWSKEIDLDTIRYCQDHDIMVIAHKPFHRGLINEEKLKLLSALAKKYKKTEAQLVLNWLTAKKNVVTLFKSGNVQHIRENQAIFDFQLTKQEHQQFDLIVQKNQA